MASIANSESLREGLPRPKLMDFTWISLLVSALSNGSHKRSCFGSKGGLGAEAPILGPRSVANVSNFSYSLRWFPVNEAMTRWGELIKMMIYHDLPIESDEFPLRKSSTKRPDIWYRWVFLQGFPPALNSRHRNSWRLSPSWSAAVRRWQWKIFFMFLADHEDSMVLCLPGLRSLKKLLFYFRWMGH